MGSTTNLLEQGDKFTTRDGQDLEVVRDFGLYVVGVGKSISPEANGRSVFQIVHKTWGVVEEEASMLPTALIHAYQFNSAVRNDNWEDRLNQGQGRVMQPQEAGKISVPSKH